MSEIKQKRILVLFLTLVLFSIFAVFILPTFAYAQDVGAPLANGQIDTTGVGGNPVEGDLLGKFGRWIGNVIISLAAWFTGIAGGLLDESVHTLVLSMGSNLAPSSDVGQAINSSWSVIRDFANLFFIFGFVYIGILTIFDYQNANTKRWLVSIIIGALLINFSLVITKVVIDVANITAVQIYNTGIGSEQVGQKTLELLQLKEFYTNVNPAAIAGTTSGGEFWYYVGAALFLLIAAFVFLAGAILLIIRYVALVLIMVFSPLLFAATVFPQTKAAASYLWSKLFSYAFFAPIYFLFIFISFKLIEGLGKRVVATDFSTQIQNGVNALTTTSPLGSYSVILNFFLIIAFMVASLIAAKQLGIYGGEQAIKVGQNIRGRAQRGLGNVTIGGAARGLRSTVGYGGQRLTESKAVQNLARRGGLAGKAGRTALVAGKKTSEASFDARRIAGVGKALDIGEGKKGGFAQDVKDRTKREQDIVKMLKDDEKIFEDMGLGKQQQYLKDVREQRDKALIERSQAKTDAERTRLSRLVTELGSEIDYMEKASNRNAPPMPSSMAAKGWKRDDFKTRHALESLSRNIPKEEYAANLANRKFTTWAGRKKNREAASAIKKDIKKSDNDKILDALNRPAPGGGGAASASTP